MPLMNQVEFAAHRGNTKQAVGKMVAAGRIALTQDKKIDSDVADAQLSDIFDPARAQAPAQRLAPAQNSEFTAAKTDVTVFQAKNAALDWARNIGSVVDTASTFDETLTMAREIRDRFLRLDREIAGLLAGCADEKQCRAIVRTGVETCLKDVVKKLKLAEFDVKDGPAFDIAAE